MSIAMEDGKQRPLGRIVVAGVFGLVSLNALGQALMAITGRSDAPMALIILQTAVGVTGMSAAVGAWRLTSWAPAAAIAYGVATAGMLTSLPGLLDLVAEARPGIWTGAVSVLVFSLLAAWYLRRLVRSRAPA